MTATYSDCVAGEVRAEMARQRVTQRQLAADADWDERYLSRRLRSEVPFSVDDIDVISQLLGISPSKLTSPAPE